ncbi:MAG: sigma-70 family RNA polymerase sigma factor [Candidatus Sulfopaludibacter sp.]|nr:sigma-70 family RNA polymerase sigma factor [Candidatus Sulfopaludibacter sp.]
MGPAPSVKITRLLREWQAGDQAALDRLTPLVYGELHRVALRCMGGGRPGNSLQPTALVNEAYLRLVDADGIRWQDRAHFFAVSAQMMRRILVDFARARGAEKRGGGAVRFSVKESIDGMVDRSAELIALDETLDALARLDPRKAQVIELRFFGGLSVEETAEVLKISPQSVMRDWKLARAWLMREMAR